MTIRWTHKPFVQLSAEEMYQLLRLRSEVFVVEQNCVFLDADNHDQACEHLMGWSESGLLLAYTRIVPARECFAEPSIGRVVTSPAGRGSGIGRELMMRSIALTRQLHGPGPIRIGAQCYLLDFYASLGFETVSEVYLEDGIEHVEMLLK